MSESAHDFANFMPLPNHNIMERPKVATKSMWETHPLDHPRKIAIDLQFNTQQGEKIKKGFIPMDMDDKWFIFHENGWLNFHRSWTGFCAYKAELKETPGSYSINEFWAERSADKYKGTDDQEDIDSLVLLIAGHLLNGNISKAIRDKYLIPYYEKMEEIFKPDSEEEKKDSIIAVPNCHYCIHFDQNNLDIATCKAFPNGIPDTIYWKGRKHNKPRKDQEGNFIFARIPMTLSELEEFYSNRHNNYLAISQREKKMFEYWPLFSLAVNNDPFLIVNELHRWQKYNYDLLAVYPGQGHEVPKGAEYIGEIEDGNLYFVKPE